MGRRGRKRQLELESRVLAVDPGRGRDGRGVPAVGIGRKTGYRWRAERGGLPPARLGEAGAVGRYLSLLERQRIATLRRLGLGVRAIAGGSGAVAVDGQPRAAPQPAAPRPQPTTVTWRTPGPGSGPAGPAAPPGIDDELRGWSRPSWSWSGARSRSPPGCA